MLHDDDDGDKHDGDDAAHVDGGPALQAERGKEHGTPPVTHELGRGHRDKRKSEAPHDVAAEGGE